MRFLDVGFVNKYPYTDFHELNLDWCIRTIKTLFESVKDIDGWIETHEDEYKQLKELSIKIDEEAIAAMKSEES